MLRYALLFSFLAILSMFSTPIQAAEDTETSLTIYSKARPGSLSPHLYRPTPGAASWRYNQIPGYATIREIRNVTLKDNRSTVRITDVAALIDPTTVSFKSLTEPAHTSVLEQSYHFDLVSQDKLLERFVGEIITVEQHTQTGIETIQGTLLSARGGIILETDGGKIVTIGNYSNIQFPKLPGGLITKPTLLWDIFTQKPGDHKAEISYQTQGITWWADYNLVYTDGDNENEGMLDVGAWVSIANKSGTSYNNSNLKLIAGDVQRASNTGRGVQHMDMMRFNKAQASSPEGFKEKSFFEYHLYTLGRKTSIPDNSTKQIELFPKAMSIPAEKKYVYYGNSNRRYYGSVNYNRNLGTQMNKKVDVYLSFKNEKKRGLGIPLPAGRVRVSKMDPDDGSMEFIGEDIIDHTPKDEEVSIKLGSAFDIVGERKQIDFQVDRNRKWMKESFEITLRNHKENPVNVLVKENLHRAVNWKISTSNTKYEKQDAFTIHFPVTIARDGEKKIRYTVHYTW